MQKLQSAGIISVVEAIASQQAATPAFAGSGLRDVPPFVPKAAQLHAGAAARRLLQRFVLLSVRPLQACACESFRDPGFLSVAADDVGAARPWCGQVLEGLVRMRRDAACLLPAGEALPAGLVRSGLAAGNMCACHLCLVKHVENTDAGGKQIDD